VYPDNLKRQSTTPQPEATEQQSPAGKLSVLPHFNKKDLLIIGFGSPLRGDDVAGRYAARLLNEQGFRTLDVHQLTPELAEEIASAREVLFLDAHAELPPGEISIERLSSKPSATGPLEHSASPAGLLRLTRRTYGAEPIAWLIGMGGAEFEMSDGLSAAAERAVDRAIAEIIRCTNPVS
jgi:hydrogenase maturation protease